MSPENNTNIEEEGETHLDEHDPENTPDGEHDGHRNDRFACSAEESRHRVTEGKSPEEPSGNQTLLHTEADDLAVAGEDRHHLTAEDHQCEPHQLGESHREEYAETGCFPHPILFSGTEVLPGERRQGEGEGGDGDERKALDSVVRAVGGHRRRAEEVDR